MRVFVISDTHFGHTNLEKMGVRPSGFEDKIVKNWNQSVSSDDLVIHLGDYIVGKESAKKHIIHGLNGNKVLVIGNHDKRSIPCYLNNGFDFVCYSFTWKYFGLKILFTHAPSEIGTNDLNIHGHLHNGRHRDEFKLTDKHVLFSLEQQNYTPVPLKTLIKMHKKK